MFDFHDVMSLSNINTCCLHRMNTRRTIGQSGGVAPAGDDQVPSKAPAEAVAILVNPAGLTDGEVRESLAQMAQDITRKA